MWLVIDLRVLYEVEKGEEGGYGVKVQYGLLQKHFLTSKQWVHFLVRTFQSLVILYSSIQRLFLLGFIIKTGVGTMNWLLEY